MLNTSYASYQDAPVPPGYETAYAHMSREMPEAFDWLADPEIAVAEGDHPGLTCMAHSACLATIEVEAPTALKRFGIEKVTAFPMEVLWRYYG